VCKTGESAIWKRWHLQLGSVGLDGVHEVSDGFVKTPLGILPHTNPGEVLWLQIAGLLALSSKALKHCPRSQKQMHLLLSPSNFTNLAGPTISATYLVHTP